MTYVPPTLQESGSVGIEGLRGKFAGHTGYIVGKGPSLARVRASDFETPGFVVAINESILTMQNLGLPMQIFAMQKEGCEARDENGARPCGSCAPFGWKRAPLVDPYPGIATLFNRHLASWCLHGRPNRYVYDQADLGLPDYPHIMSVLDAIPFARFLGAERLVMVAFDSITMGVMTNVDDERYTEEQRDVIRSNLEWQVPRLLDALKPIPHTFLTPGR